MDREKRTCNYCEEDMEYSAEFAEVVVCVCTKPDCPVYALLQIAMEKMVKAEEK